MNILDSTQLRALVPAAFATEPADTVSSRYRFIPTERMIYRMADKGWFPVRARQSGRSKYQEHGTHMITFRQSEGRLHVGQVIGEINLTNNHMAKQAYQFLAGLFRCFCDNQCVAPAGQGLDVRERHLGTDRDIDLSIDAGLNNLDLALQKMEKWQRITLEQELQSLLAYRGLLLRGFTHAEAYKDRLEVLKRKRPEDQGNDLWSVFNVVQEKVIKGYKTLEDVFDVRNKTSKEWVPVRKITSIDRSLKINQALWRLAESYE